MKGAYGIMSRKKNVLSFVIEPIFSFYQKYYVKVSIETKLIYFFSLIFLTLWVRLFFLQVINHTLYEETLYGQHSSQTQLEPKR